MTASISQIMRILPKTHMDTLMAAFEEGIPSYHEYAPKRFIGVNTDQLPHLLCEQEAGSWREGRIKSNESSTQP